MKLKIIPKSDFARETLSRLIIAGLDYDLIARAVYKSIETNDPFVFLVDPSSTITVQFPTKDFDVTETMPINPKEWNDADDVAEIAENGSHWIVMMIDDTVDTATFRDGIFYIEDRDGPYECDAIWAVAPPVGF